MKKLFLTTIVLFTRLIYKVASPRVKRIIFWASVYGYFKGDDATNIEFLKTANNEMHLCHDPAALALPVSLHSMVWSDNPEVVKSLEKCINCDQSQGFEAFVASIPAWLRYDNAQKLLTDVKSFMAIKPMMVAA